MTKVDRRNYLKMMGGTIAAATVAGTPEVGVASAMLQEPGVPAIAKNADLFLDLSVVLTGQPRENLDIALALEYMERVDAETPGVLDTLLSTFEQLVAQAGGNQGRLVALVRQELWSPEGCTTMDLQGNQLCDPSGNPVCCATRNIPLLWYAAALMVPTNLESPATKFEYGSTASYLGALSWKVADAHPQAQCGGTYGYWSTPPGVPHSTTG